VGKTEAERQRRYRERCRVEGDGRRNLNVWIGSGAFLALRRLAHHGGESQRAVLERLIVAADDEIVRGLASDSDEWDTYFGGPTDGQG
jgi:hypothetical protein